MSTKHHWIEHDITEQVQAWHDDADGSDWLELAATTVEVRVEEGIDPGTSTTIVRLRLPRFFGQRMRAAFADATAAARRKTERLRLAERLEAAGLLEDTAVLAIADLDDG
ncbi:MAG: hypothetical protein IPH07_23810 [Deltaproteobacteria bacterium]|nr:hypothetical protein [Deltaproteobacteria bacterium]